MGRMPLVIAVAIAALAMSAQADMTYAPFMIGGALNHSGTPIADGTFVMVLDLDNDGCNGASYLAQSTGGATTSSWLWDTDDLLMDRGQIIGGDAFPFCQIITSQKPATYTPDVNHYYMLWFDTPYNAAGAGPGSGVWYGAEDLGTVGVDPGDYNPFPVGGNTTLQTAQGHSWHNSTLAKDVNGDGFVTAADAMAIINKINTEGSHALQLPDDLLPPPDGAGMFWDVSNDPAPHLSPLDALMVINELNLTVGQGAVAEPTSLGQGAVPEPTSLVLLLLGASFHVARRRSRLNS